VEDQPRILIIDDEEVVLDSCKRILEGRNYRVATAMDGTFGMTLVREFRPDLVYVDLKMPGISGFEVIEQIREFDPTVVTIVITGYATVESAVEAIQKGAYDFLPKPFSPDELRVITQRGLEKRKLQQEAMALRREKEVLREHFAAIVSHELKAPLGNVQQNLFALELELEDQLTEDQRDRLSRMKSSLDNLMGLIHTWLRVISTDIQQIRESFQPISIPAVIKNAVESLQAHADRKDIEIVTSISKPLPSVSGDDITLTEALVNLINNAIKYSRMESQVHVSAEEEADEILVSVTDRGVGISNEDLPFIFGDFYVGESAPEAERGSGLGLGITRRIVEAHDGTIMVESALGKGSTFMIRLPTISDQDQSERAPEQGDAVETIKEA
jgi:signal transduction histidine kinase